MFTLLVIESDPLTSELLEQFVAGSRWTVVAVKEIDEARRLIHGGEVRCVLLGIAHFWSVTETAENCSRLMAMIASGASVQRPPVIINAGATTKKDSRIKAALKLGVADVVYHPLRPLSLHTTLTKHCPNTRRASFSKFEAPELARRAASVSQIWESDTDVLGSAGSEMLRKSLASDTGMVRSWCSNIGLEYVGMQLEKKGWDWKRLTEAKDADLRDAGVVVQKQRRLLMTSVASWSVSSDDA